MATGSLRASAVLAAFFGLTAPLVMTVVVWKVLELREAAGFVRAESV